MLRQGVDHKPLRTQIDNGLIHCQFFSIIGVDTTLKSGNTHLFTSQNELSTMSIKVYYEARGKTLFPGLCIKFSAVTCTPSLRAWQVPQSSPRLSLPEQG